MPEAKVVVKGPYRRDMALDIAMQLGLDQLVEVRGHEHESEVIVANMTREKLKEILIGMGFEILE